MGGEDDEDFGSHCENILSPLGRKYKKGTQSGKVLHFLRVKVLKLLYACPPPAPVVMSKISKAGTSLNRVCGAPLEMMSKVAIILGPRHSVFFRLRLWVCELLPKLLTASFFLNALD